MSETVLVAETGRPTGSAAARRMRADDVIPAVVYGQGMEPISISVKRRDLRHALSGPAGLNTVLDLTVDGSVFPAIVKDIQRHPVRRTVSHVDFIQVNLDQEITVSVPLRLEGEIPNEIQSANGLIDPAVDHIEVTTTPRRIPDEFVVDISEFTLDTVVHLADLPMPSGVTATGDPELVIVTVLVIKEEVFEEPAAEAAEGEVGEGEAAAGAAAAAEGGAATDGGEAAADDAGAGE